MSRPAGAEPCGSQGPHGVDYYGDQNTTTDAQCLTPRGWSRAGALVSFFDPYDGHLRTGIATPQQLLCPGYRKGQTPDLARMDHRTYQAICQLADELNVEIDFHYQEGDKKTMGQDLANVTTGITLVSWEHTAIPTIAKPIAPGADIPPTWPDRFDMVWSFVSAGSGYDFTQIPQMLLPGGRRAADQRRGRSGRR